MAAAVAAEKGNTILDSRLVAYENEILKLKKETKTLKTDLQESSTSVAKLTNELKLSRSNLEALQTENKTLKLSVKQITEKHDSSSVKVKETTQKNEQLLIRAEEAEKSLKNVQAQNNLLKETVNKNEEVLAKKIKHLNLQHAKELGKVQNCKKNELDERINQFAKIENNLKAEISSMQKQSSSMDLEYKEIITGQAQRLHAYEQQINIMEKQMNRLSIQNEFKSIPRVSNTDREMITLKTENNSLLESNRKKDDEIQQLLNRLAMVRLNSHYDFRNKGQF